MSVLKKCAAENIYRMEEGSAWIFAGDTDVWIIKGELGLSISVWSKDTREDPLDSIFINCNQIKGEKE